jgi:hypothetical protein
LPGGGAVQVNDVETWRPQRLPFQGNIEGVFRKDNLLVVIALVQADAFAVPQVYRRYYLYFSASSGYL